MNAHVRQKSLDALEGLAVIRCDGGGTFGFGHVKRSITLARALRDREGLGVVFAINGEQEAAQITRDAGFETVLLPHTGQSNVLASLVADKRPDIFIADARENLSRELFARISSTVPVVAVIDDSSDRRLVATHAYYPPVPQTEKLNWNGAETVVRTGWEWALLGFDPQLATGLPVARDPVRRRVVISMGGSDPLDLTRFAARALVKITTPFQARFVIGPGFRNAPSMAREIEAMSVNFESVVGVSDLGSEFAAADAALIVFGVTAYELGALGVPALYIALSDDHALSASAFEQVGMGMVLGLGRVVRPEDIARAVWRLIDDSERRHDMRAAGLNTIDGRGGQRIAADLVKALAAAKNMPRVARS